MRYITPRALGTGTRYHVVVGGVRQYSGLVTRRCQPVTNVPVASVLVRLHTDLGDHVQRAVPDDRRVGDGQGGLLPATVNDRRRNATEQQPPRLAR